MCLLQWHRHHNFVGDCLTIYQVLQNRCITTRLLSRALYLWFPPLFHSQDLSGDKQKEKEGESGRSWPDASGEGKWLCQAIIFAPESIIHKSTAKRQSLKCSPHIGVTTVPSARSASQFSTESSSESRLRKRRIWMDQRRQEGEKLDGRNSLGARHSPLQPPSPSQQCGEICELAMSSEGYIL